TNPLILGCLAGIFLNVTGVGLPGWSADTLRILGAVALPMGLLAVGVALKPTNMGQDWPPILKSSVLKFVLLPGLMFGLATLLQLDPRSTQILLLLGCLPTASSAYILARQMGGDTILMARIITLQTLMAFAIIPLWLALT
ncbi:MAG: AEC family transporter, partial [Natronospirillum sp.]